MSALKIIAFLLAIGLAAFALKMLTRPEPVRPPNERVHENNFDQLRSGMTEAQVEKILGSPDKTVGGEVVQRERLGATELQGTIQEEPFMPGGNKLHVYQGPNDESIEVLFSAQKGTVVAAEYYVSDYPVIYRGPRVAKRSEDLVAIATRRIVEPVEKQEQQESVARFQRRQTLKKRTGNSFFDPSTPAPDPAPVATSASAPASVPSFQPTAQPLASESPPLQRQPVQPCSSASQSSVPAAATREESAVKTPAIPAPAVRTNAAGDRTGPLEIKLPSGKLLTESVPKFDLPQPWPDKLFIRGETVFVATSPKKSIRGVFTVKKPKLDGPSATLHDNGRLETVAFYADGKLHGPLRVWSDQKERLLYAEYKNGKKHGLLCLFSEKLPWLIQEWETATLQQEYLVQYADELPAALPASELTGAEAEEFARAKDRLAELEQKLCAKEIAFRKDVADWIRKDIRKTKPQRTPQQQQRTPQRTPAQRPVAQRPPAHAPLPDPNAVPTYQLETQWRAALGRAEN